MNGARDTHIDTDTKEAGKRQRLSGASSQQTLHAPGEGSRKSSWTGP